MVIPSRGTFTISATGLLIFALAFVCRLGELSGSFSGGQAVVPPLDDLYHAKRIVYSALHFPSSLEFDSRRGVNGAFCPWPPLYDVVAGGLARALGGRTPQGILDRVVWFPPLVGAGFAGLLASALALRAGVGTGILGGAAVAFSLPLISFSRVGSIDHHFLEPPLLFAIVLVTARTLRAKERGGLLGNAAAFGAVLACALFVQVALLMAAGLVLAAILLWDSVEARSAEIGALGFSFGALLLGIYRFTRRPGYPAGEWFLGLSHIAALIGAAVACATCAALRSRPWVVRVSLSILAGIATITLIPSGMESFIAGSRFFSGGDPWLDRIQEFEPLLEGHSPGMALCLLGGGVLLFPPFLVQAYRRGATGELVLGLFAGTYVVAAISRERMLILAAPLLASAGALFTADLLARGRRLLGAASAFLTLAPTLMVGIPVALHPEPVVPPFAAAAIRASVFLKSRAPRSGRVLAPWSWGHVFNVVGERGVLIDNFGTMVGNAQFEEAERAFLDTREEKLAEFCRQRNVRFLVLDNPLLRLPVVAETIGLDRNFYMRAGRRPEDPGVVTHLMQSTVWWRAYFFRGRVRPEAGRSGLPLTRFRCIYEDPDPSWEPAPYLGPALQIWELID